VCVYQIQCVRACVLFVRACVRQRQDISGLCATDLQISRCSCLCSPNKLRRLSRVTSKSVASWLLTVMVKREASPMKRAFSPQRCPASNMETCDGRSRPLVVHV
jgi:hypothetical protein